MRQIALALIYGSAIFTLPTAASQPYSTRPDCYQAGSQQLAYPVPEHGIPALTPAPDGYTPFHIEHYGRHGSRWLLSGKDYSEPVRMLRKAKEYGKLTARGEQLLVELAFVEKESQNRLGELTPLGHRQHRGIARRMVSNFPEIFTDSTRVDAKSTVVIRCILSMANEIAEIESLVPGIHTRMDASRTTQNTFDHWDKNDTILHKTIDEAHKLDKAYAETLPKPDTFFDVIFNDRQFVRDSIGEQDFFDRVFFLAVNMQSHDSYPDIYDVFTSDELYNAWLARNAQWYISSGNNPMTNHMAPFNQAILLRNIIESADTALTSPHISANLRFGHESVLLPLSALMQINNAAYSTDNFATLAEHWRNYEIFPMGSNIQIVFYRPIERKGENPDDVLVKVLLNESEASLPVDPVVGPYYRWTALRDYYLSKLETH